MTIGAVGRGDMTIGGVGRGVVGSGVVRRGVVRRGGVGRAGRMGGLGRHLGGWGGHQGPDDSEIKGIDCQTFICDLSNEVKNG